MAKRKLLLIFLIVLGFPLLGLALSFATSHYATPLATNNDGIGDGKALIVIGAIVYGILGIVASLIFGPLVSHLTRRSNNLTLSLSGYFIPSLIAFFIVLWGFVSVVVVTNPSPY
jgi:MFS family permease